MAGKEGERDAADIAVLFPGKLVEVETGKGKLSWQVHPVSLRHMRKFSLAVGRAVAAIGTLEVSKGGKLEDRARSVIPVVVPIVLEDLLDLVVECCVQPEGQMPRMDIRDLPHWLVVPVVEVWIDESFGSEDKLRPWVAATERLLSRASGKPIDIWRTLSKLSSPQATS